MNPITYTSFRDHPLTAFSFFQNSTRFNPTTSGPLHIGHLYLILVNCHEAHVSGGKFVFRIEDDSPEWQWRIGDEKTKQYIDSYREDMDWMGIEPDIWLLQSELRGDVLELRNRLAPDWKAENRYMYEVPWVRGREQVVYYPYAPQLTLERVILDIFSGVNLLIRGMDLLTEHCLYLHCCDLMGLPYPRCVYLPRLRRRDRNEFLRTISKTSGGYTIANFREQGWTPAELLNRLSHSCLDQPSGPWSIANVKVDPLWDF